MSGIDIVVGAPTGREVSPDLWGLFLEDINFALDGGLNADLVQNGDFEAGPADRPGWGPLTAWSVDAGEVRVRSADGVSSANATHVRLEDAVLVNRGYNDDGMPVPSPTLRLRLWARAASVEGRLSARLDGAGTVDLPLTAEWRVIEADLAAPDAHRTSLVLEGSGVDVDLVELRPLDASGEPVLFRPDLVETLRALKPAFVRFPGGCLVHGFGLDNMYHWKTTVGPREQRRPLPNTWGYHQSMAIGYHEYFLLCEALGATPLPIVAAGVSCQNTPGGAQAIPIGRMPQYVQDVLDLVEYANGDADSRWGAVRAAAGHPAPFGLRMLGVGNEDTIDAQFTERFEQIAQALQEAHPEVALIGTAGPWPFGRDFEAGWEIARRLDIDLVDEHGYRTPRWHWQNHERYDSADRTGPAVYLGEWAARGSTVRSAMAEAGYMIGLERNSDVVRMASYAPLLARVGETQWTPDLIYFTDDEVIGSAAYDVHALFAAHRGDRVLPVSVSGDARREQPEPRLGPAVLRSPGARTAFTGIVADGVALPDVVVDDEHPEALLAIPPETRSLAFTATRRSGVEGFDVVLGDPASGTSHEVIVGSWRNRSLILSRRDDGFGDEVDGPYIFEGVQTGVPRRIEIERDGSRLTVRHDGVLVHDHVDDRRPYREVAVGATARGAETVVTIVNGGGAAVSARVAGPAGPLAADAVLLEGGDPLAGAAFEPSPLRRVESVLSGTDELRVDVPAWSIAALVIREAPGASA
ncbi:alpha-L-arabinofuranosidase C-terminal domain-containing protein [Rathayibacter oskolensis]|uniref:alpha-L-arabinofuranosidase C-terminal domain-containing protein n=1 Tax=Rathayibacter oskolensis TaxID=1891671 RepID=UPI0026601EF4|nr:alpha-L-arabinofuranosidase C-terminal domain-containing protein [Rathayibacter oskolensis]WKK73166.1 alpha-L-arabinofuranosidase C-terminal domain-containing protein [Rathayibacter oskolensis]